MARFISDQNKIVGIFESGTYGTAMTGSGFFWLGQVTENTIDDAENVLENRFLGALNRSVNKIDQGPRDVTGTVVYNAQDMRVVAMAIGSIFSVSGTVAQHTATEINTDVQQSPFASGTNQLNAPISFSLEDSKQSPGTGRNFIRTINGVVPNATTVTATQGEKISVSMDYIGQTVLFSSGTTTSITESTQRPYLWSDCALDILSDTGNRSGLNTVKEISLEINQNREGPHYLNGSRDIATPFNGNRDYVLSLTMDLDGDDADMLYNEFYKGGSQFNVEFDLDGDVTSVGSQHAEFHMSGCWIRSMENPSTMEGTTESTIDIGVGSMNMLEWTQGNTISSGLYHIGNDW